MSSKCFKSVIAQDEPSTSRCNKQTESNLPVLIKDVQTTRRNKWLIKPRSKDNVIKIKVDGKTFFIKRNVLINHSMLFQKALPHSDKLDVSMCLIGVNKLTFEVIKDWMKGKKNVVNENNAHQVMDVAKKLEMIDLLNECKQLAREFGGQDEGASGSWYQTSKIGLESNKKKGYQLEKPKARLKEEERRRKEELKQQKKIQKEEEHKRKAEKKKDKKRKKKIKKIESDVDSAVSEVVQDTTSMLQKARDQFVTTASESDQPTTLQYSKKRKKEIKKRNRKSDVDSVVSEAVNYRNATSMLQKAQDQSETMESDEPTALKFSEKRKKKFKKRNRRSDIDSVDSEALSYYNIGLNLQKAQEQFVAMKAALADSLSPSSLQMSRASTMSDETKDTKKRCDVM